MQSDPLFSILIPTWNNLAYLQLCQKALVENSAFQHEVIFHVNEGTDGTLDWVKENRFKFTHFEKNIGICRSLNAAFTQATCKWIVYMNDDMYVLPGWDKALHKAIREQPEELFMLSSTMIEHTDTGNNCVVIGDFGKSLAGFSEAELLAAAKKLSMDNWNGATWPPSLISREAWEKVNGYSEEFSPGMYSDPDLSMKLWQAGCRNFQGVGSSLVYHFQAKSTSKIVKNDGRKQFIKKWGITPSTFYKYYLRSPHKFSPQSITK